MACTSTTLVYFLRMFTETFIICRPRARWNGSRLLESSVPSPPLPTIPEPNSRPNRRMSMATWCDDSWPTDSPAQRRTNTAVTCNSPSRSLALFVVVLFVASVVNLVWPASHYSREYAKFRSNPEVWFWFPFALHHFTAPASETRIPCLSLLLFPFIIFYYYLFSVGTFQTTTMAAAA